MTSSIIITAPDTHSDWWDDYIDSIEKESGFRWTGDDSMYGVFVDAAGNRYKAYVNPALSNTEQWTVDLDLVDEVA